MICELFEKFGSERFPLRIKYAIVNEKSHILISQRDMMGLVSERKRLYGRKYMHLERQETLYVVSVQFYKILD